MNKKVIIFITALFITLWGCGRKTIPPVPNLADDTESTSMETVHQNIEKQLQVIMDHYGWDSLLQFEVYPNYRYTIADLDQNGRLELISTLQQGSGLYTDSWYYEVNEAFDGLNEYKPDNAESDSGADIAEDSVPVYFDLDHHIYFYIFDDRIRDGADLDYKNKRTISLKDGKLTEHILAYQTDWHKETAASITCTDADGNEISEHEYNNIADTVFPDLIKKEAHFYWFNIDDIESSGLNTILLKSYHGFLIQ